MKLTRLFLIAALLLACRQTASAKVILPPIISDNMVLQRQSTVRLWGNATASATVTIKPSWCGRTFKTKADAETGKWEARIPTPKAGGPFEITFSDGEKTTIRNILIGEVWFASGQSNMEMTMTGYGVKILGVDETLATAKASRPIRICKIADQSSITVMDSVGADWMENTPDAIEKTSAVAYFFADALQKVLDVPVGIITASRGSSSIQSWMTRELLEEKFPEVDLGSVKGEHPVVNELQDPCMLYNGMVAPIIPFTFKGILWYQGETNREHPEQYIRLQKEYVAMMRRLFKAPDAPFYFVQIAPWHYSDPTNYQNGYFNEGQQKSLEVIPNSGMVSTCDIGSYVIIHPAHKREVGQRLALLALQKDYGFSHINAESPSVKSISFNGDKASIIFNVDKLMTGIVSDEITGFELAGEDKVFHPAEAVLDRVNPSRIIVSSKDVSNPVAIRYCFRNWCKGNLYSTFGIPVAPFRTDDWNVMH